MVKYAHKRKKTKKVGDEGWGGAITAPCGQDTTPYGSKPILWKIIVHSNYCWGKKGIPQLDHLSLLTVIFTQQVFSEIRSQFLLVSFSLKSPRTFHVPFSSAWASPALLPFLADGQPRRPSVSQTQCLPEHPPPFLLPPIFTWIFLFCSFSISAQCADCQLGWSRS